jgi:hypothetical protein
LEIERAIALFNRLFETDWRTSNLPLTPTISPYTSNQNFEIAIFFNVVESSGYYFFEDDHHPPPTHTHLRARVVSYGLAAYKAFIELYNRKFEGLVPLSLVKSDWKKTNTPPTLTISPKTSNNNFEIAIFFNVVKKSGNYVFEDDTPPTAFSARVISYARMVVSCL